MDQVWDPSVERQAIKRGTLHNLHRNNKHQEREPVTFPVVRFNFLLMCAAHRIGQTREVLVEKLVMKDTIEATILAINEDKSLATRPGTPC